MSLLGPFLEKVDRSRGAAFLLEELRLLGLAAAPTVLQGSLGTGFRTIGASLFFA
jgi:hypothetical protein